MSIKVSAHKYCSPIFLRVNLMAKCFNLERVHNSHINVVNKNNHYFGARF